MESTETRIKEMIIHEYGSLKKFCEIIDMPWTTLDSILKRGISNSNITNVMKITKELGIDTESLASGIIKDSFLKSNSMPQSNQTKENPKILQYYESLNTLGKEAATEHVRLLTLDEKYTQPDQVISIVREPDSDYLAPDAAHSKKGANAADQEYDNREIMDNDDLWKK